jgi:hypothetical protein
VLSRVWNKVCSKGYGTKCALKGPERGVLSRVWNEVCSQGLGTRFPFGGLEQGVPSRVWNETLPQGYGTRCALKDLEQGVPSRAWSVLLWPQNTVYLGNTDAISHSPHFCILHFNMLCSVSCSCRHVLNGLQNM